CRVRMGSVGEKIGVECADGVVIGGVRRPRKGDGCGGLGDLDRIEVLEGPQGELFGKNNDAGVINVITRRPSRTFAVEGELSGGNFSDREIRASVTGPLGDSQAFLLYAGYQKRDGFLDVFTGPGPNSNDKANDRNFWTVRGQYLFTPNSDVSLLIIGDFTRRNEVCCQATPSTSGPFAGIINAMATIPQLGGTETPAQAFPVTNPMPFNGQSWANWPIGQNIWDRGFSAQLGWNFGGARLTSITAWRDNTVFAGNDVDYSEVALIQNPANINNMNDFKQISEELRLAGKTDRLTWLIGAFANKEI